MLDLATEATMLGTLLEETRGVVGVALGNDEGELRAIVGNVADGDASAAVAASLTGELGRLGAVLGLGEFAVASIRATTATRVFARQSGATVVIELDPKRPLGDLETKLRTMAWAPEDEILEPAVNRVPTVPRDHDRIQSSAAALPLPLPPPPPAGTTGHRPPSARSQRDARTTPPPLAGAPVRPTPPPSLFTGDLEEFCLPDLLEFLRNTHRTGLLVCTSAAGIGTVQLSRGMITSADSPNAIDLREHFLMSPELDVERRRVLGTLPADSFDDDVIDDVLVGRELVGPDDLERARTARIYSAFREMMGWNAGRFSFDPSVPVPASPALALSAQSILMHIYQEQDEQGR
jgi:uncharacterized protein DUF4388